MKTLAILCAKTTRPIHILNRLATILTANSRSAKKNNWAQKLHEPCSINCKTLRKAEKKQFAQQTSWERDLFLWGKLRITAVVPSWANCNLAHQWLLLSESSVRASRTSLRHPWIPAPEMNLPLYEGWLLQDIAYFPVHTLNATCHRNCASLKWEIYAGMLQVGLAHREKAKDCNAKIYFTLCQYTMHSVNSLRNDHCSVDLFLSEQHSWGTLYTERFERSNVPKLHVQTPSNLCFEECETNKTGKICVVQVKY